MSEYTPLPTNTENAEKNVSKSGAKSVVALLVMSLCAGSVAVFSSMKPGTTAQVEQLNTETVPQTTASCIDGSAGPVLAGYDLVRFIYMRFLFLLFYGLFSCVGVYLRILLSFLWAGCLLLARSGR